MKRTELGQHVILRLADDRVIARTPAERRVLARVLLEAGRPFRLLAFKSVDSHVHAEPACSRAEAGEFVRRVKISLRQRLDLGVDFSPARFKTIADQHHLLSTFFYILRQSEHHGYEEDPFHDASNLPDLLGLRVVGGYTGDNVRSLVPRVRREQLLSILGTGELEDLDDVPVRLLPDAASAAAGLPALVGRSREVVLARRAAARVARRFAPAELGGVLGCSERTVRRLKREAAPSSLVRAVALQLRLRAARAEPPAGRLAAGARSTWHTVAADEAGPLARRAALEPAQAAEGRRGRRNAAGTERPVRAARADPGEHGGDGGSFRVPG